MGIIIFLVFCVISAICFFVWDTRQHRKTIINAIITINKNERYLVRYKAKEIEKEYPVLSEVALSFAISDKNYNDKEIIKNVKTLDKEAKKKLDLEIEKLISKRDEGAKFVAKWYMMTCLIVDAVSEQESISEIEQKTKQISAERYNEIDSKDFCLI